MSTAAPVGPPSSSNRRSPRPAFSAWRLLRPLASLQLTVGLFALSMVLVFFGTLAQMNQGLWTVLHTYFRSAFVSIPFDLVHQFGIVFFDLAKDGPKWGGSFPFPGGYAIGGLMLLNLTAAHLYRFRFTPSRYGVILLHSGVVLLLLGELITGLFAVEATMTIAAGETARYVDVSNASELVLIDSSSPDRDSVLSVSNRVLARAAERHEPVRDTLLPVDIRVDAFWPNSDAVDANPKDNPDPATVLTHTLSGRPFHVVPRDEAAGVDQEQRENATSARVTLLKKGTDEPVGSFFVSNWFNANYTRRQFEPKVQTFAADGKTYAVEMRPMRVYKPYAIHLKKFEHSLYPGTDKPKDFASTVQLIDPRQGEDREVRIWMNNPLRYDASKPQGLWGTLKSLNPLYNESETFYQAGFLPGDRGTILQVVQNPSWMWPYVSCGLVALGMLFHFARGLSKFVAKGLAGVSLTPEGVPAIDRSPSRWPVVAACVLTLLTAGWLASKARPPHVRDGQKDRTPSGRCPCARAGGCSRWTPTPATA